jgi:hypothetical protein
MLNLALAYMNSEIGTMIGSSIGQVEEGETNEDGVGWGQFLRVKIRMDLTKPLMRGMRLRCKGSLCGLISSINSYHVWV